jgi:hypothetical protein
VGRFAALVACVAVCLTLAGAALAGLTVGANDDAGKLDTISPWFYPTMKSEGLTLNTMTVLWDDTNPTAIPGEAQIAKAIAAAAANGIQIELDLYPLHAQAFTGGGQCGVSTDPEACGETAAIQAFAAWTAMVAQQFPTVHQFVVMNECNQPLFINPQWNRKGLNQSAEICGRALVAAYDALKGVSPSNLVWGLGLSPRGNDQPHAVSNSSTSPVKFLGDLGAWFKAYVAKTHRTAPLMDGLDFHPYPVPQSLPFTTGYPQKNDASVTNLPRIYQAFYDGFAGTPQRTIGQQARGGLPVSLNETGIQTAVSGGDYVGTEVSATAAGGVIGGFATEAYQAAWYLQMLKYVACDPNVRVVNIFHMIDETDLGGWQSGLYYSNETPKLSATTVRTWLATTGGKCQGPLHPWKPAKTPKP